MVFCSPQFCCFFLIVFAVYWAMPWDRARVYLLLAASIYFYASWSKWLTLLLLGSTIVDYLLARGMETTGRLGVRKALLLVSLFANVGLLCYFKYMNFFLQSLEEAVQNAGLELSMPTLRVIVPLGISFYTFEAINYTVDVYLRRIRAERNLAHFMLFILFFPHLAAGPIVRAKDFLPLVKRRKRWSWLRAQVGVQLILMGLMKKLAIADRMALYVDPVFAAPAAFSSFAVWMAAIAYAVQVYCDFSGYSDMAMGLAHLLGYHLAPNFNMPFLAINMADFWRRWHMSLSTWIRDYLFIPLGGSHGGLLRTYRNVLITMTLCGLWHGANWNYVLWGFLNGVLLVVHAIFKQWCLNKPAIASALASTAGTVMRVATTFCCFCLTLAVFRSPGVAAAGAAVRRMLIPTEGIGLTYLPHGLYATFALVAICHALGVRDRWLPLWERTPLPLRGLGFGATLTLALMLAPTASKAFIYFHF